MSYEANVYQIMIASPSDVAKERIIVKEIIHEWNDINALSQKIVLLPVGWETHSTPEMGERPQSIINKHILRNCDLLVGVFWTRIGTPTGDFESGTIEEINEHIKLGKPAMLYFSSTPVSPESIEQGQYSKLNSFKEKCKEEGLVETYASLSEFKDKFRRQLSIKVLSDYYVSDVSYVDPLLIEKSTQKNEMDLIIRKLSAQAKEIISEASLSNDGSLLRLRTFGGLIIQTNARQLNEPSNPRNEAAYEEAIRMLKENNLIQDLGHKNEVFSVTSLGYKIADILSKE